MGQTMRVFLKKSYSRQSSGGKPKKCKNCGKPVRETVGNSGYCKKCIALAKEE